MTSFNFPPKGWALCNGQLLPINQNQALFALLGTTFGGDGRTTFALPNLQGRTPIHVGPGYTLGQRGGEQAHTLTVSELPQHVHLVQATNNAAAGDDAADNVLAQAGLNVYAPLPGPPAGAMPAGAVGNAGSSQPRPNMQPYLTISFCIALQGVFPSQN
jgi:microcystin-dependent protein